MSVMYVRVCVFLRWGSWLFRAPVVVAQRAWDITDVVFMFTSLEVAHTYTNTLTALSEEREREIERERE